MRPPQQASVGGSRRGGFTIVEILTVIAIIAILAALLFPVVGKARENARKAKTRVQFSQWASAIEAFRQEYGFYPNFTDFADGKIDNNTKSEQFVGALSGRTIAGVAISDAAANTVGNTKKIPFYSFGAGDLTSEANPRLQDAFGNAEIVVLMDNNYNGLVDPNTAGDGYASAPAVGASGQAPAFPTNGVRAGVIFYSPGANNTAQDIVTSW